MTVNANIIPQPPRVPPPEAGASGRFELKDIVGVLRVRRGIILGTTIAVLALAAVVVFQLTPVYTARALVMLEQRQTKVVDVEAVLSGLPTDQASVENQVQLLRSYNLLSRVVDKLQLDRDPEFNPPPAGGKGWRSILSGLFGAEPVSLVTEQQAAQERREAIVDRIRGGLTIAAQGRSTTIQIGFSSSSPGKAARMTNAIAEAYVEDQLNAKLEATQAATKWLADRVQELEPQVLAAETAVQRYKAEHSLTETVAGDSVAGQQLAQVNGQLIGARSDLAEQEARLSRVDELRKSGRSADVSQVVASPLIAQLRGQEAELIRQEAELSSRYGPRHPQMLDVQNQRRNLKSKIDEEVQRVVETVSNEVAIARSRVNSLQGSLGQLTNVSTGEARARVRLGELESSAKSTRSRYEALLTRLKETQSQQDIQAPDARVITPADIPDGPSFPNKRLTLAAAGMGGLFLGLLFAVLAEQLDAGFRSASQVERMTGMPVLSVLPDVRRGLPADAIIDKPLGAFTEAVRGVELGIRLSRVDRPPKVIVVTSSVPDEGKTTVAVSLARLAAASGKKVVLVDGDLRRPGVAATFRLSKESGVIDVLSGGKPLSACMTKDPRSEARIVPAAGGAKNPADLLGSLAMEKLIHELAATHDLVIIDAAPILPVNDTRVLARVADTMLFVVRWEKTSRDAVLRAVRVLSEMNMPVAGIVLARADQARHHYYSYGYRGYGKYHGYYTS
jgi:succinoglycan biosynthesis transport protein ExoP